MMKDKVCVVTEGSYSDYHILAVFAEKKLADQFAEAAGGSVEVYNIRTGMPERATCYSVMIDAEGNETSRWSHFDWDFEKEPERAWKTGVPGFMAASYRGYDVALKAARDALAQWRARKAGL